MDSEEKQVEWRTMPMLNQEQQQTFNRILLVLIALGIGIWIGSIEFSNNVEGYNINLYTDLLSIGVTVGIIEYLNQRRAKQQLKAQLTREMASSDNGLALRAVNELSANNWLRDGSLQGLGFHSANLSRAPLNGADLQQASFISTNFEKANMWRIHLQKSFLSHSNFCEAKLGCADLVDMVATLCIFRKAEMGMSDLSRAQLHSSDFANANLWAANLRDCNLENADLRGANLSQANLQGANLENAKLDETTCLPNGEPYSPTDSNVLTRFTDPFNEFFWRPRDEEKLWWTEKGIPRPEGEAFAFHTSW